MPLSTIAPWIVLAETLIPVWAAEISLVLVIPAVRIVLETTTMPPTTDRAGIGDTAAEAGSADQYLTGRTGKV